MLKKRFFNYLKYLLIMDITVPLILLLLFNYSAQSLKVWSLISLGWVVLVCPIVTYYFSDTLITLIKKRWKS